MMTADSAIIAVGPPITDGGTSEHRLNLARSRETDRRNGYENQSPVFSYERSSSRKQAHLLVLMYMCEYVCVYVCTSM